MQHVLVRENGGGVEVEIQTSAPLSPNTQAITGPDRIVVDFPGALPSAQLRALKVNRGNLKAVRSGLFFNDPPITRIVLDLTGPQAYQISSAGNATIITLAGGAGEIGGGAGGVERARLSVPSAARLRDAALGSRPARLAPASATASLPSQIVSGARVTNASQAPNTSLENIAPPISGETAQPTQGDASQQDSPQQAVALPPTTPAVSVTYENGMLSIHADRATLSQVLYEVHLRTHAEIAIPAGAEQEKVIANLGPAPASEVLAALLNGSAYNFIVMGDEGSLQRVVLTRREGSF
ncbi:MAG: AMIN domain-containing protein [Bryobacteraceae bacterium]